MNRLWLRLVFLSVGCLFAGLVQATSLIPMNLQQLTKSARTIVKGTVTDVRTVQEDNQITSYITLNVSHCLKGEVSADNSFVFGQTVSEGSQFGNSLTHPQYKVGKTYLFFLPSHQNNNVIPIGGSQGVFEIQNEQVIELQKRKNLLRKNLNLQNTTNQDAVLNHLSLANIDLSFATLATSIQTIINDQN